MSSQPPVRPFNPIRFKRTISAATLVAGLLVSAASISAQSSVVTAPPGWIKGETHEHLQLCTTNYDPPVGSKSQYPINQTTTDILGTMVNSGMQVVNAMIWNNGALTVDQTFATYIPMVTGTEDPATISDPTRFIELGIESSGFPVASLGHISFLNISDPYFDPNLDIPFQLIDWFRQQPGLVVGAPHQMFPKDLCTPITGGKGSGFVNPPGYSFVDTSVCDLVTEGMAFPTFTFSNLIPVFLALDAASGRIDYLESIDLTFDLGPVGFTPSNVWYGLYYKLLDMGLRPSIGGGNDVNCAVTDNFLPVRTYVYMGETPLNFDNWAGRLTEGHVSLAMGDQEVLLMDVNGTQAGDELLLPMSGIVPVHVQYIGATGYDLDDTIEVLVNGKVVRSVLVDQPGGGTFDMTFNVSIPSTSWISARTTSCSTHTGAAFVTIASKPRVDLDTANYMVMFTSYLDWNLDVAENAGVVEDVVGDSLEEVRDYIEQARSAFTTRRDYAQGLPAGVQRFGRSSRAPGEDFMPIVIDDAPVEGELRKVSLFNGPPGGFATLIVSGGSDSGTPFKGANLYVDVTKIEDSVTILIDEFGHAKIDLVVPPSGGQTKYLQFVIKNPAGSSPTFSSSDAFSADY